MGVIEMMMEKNRSWQTNTHPAPLTRSGLAERLVADDKVGPVSTLHTNSMMVVLHVALIYQQDICHCDLLRDEMIATQADRKTCRHRETSAELFMYGIVAMPISIQNVLWPVVRGAFKLTPHDCLCLTAVL